MEQDKKFKHPFEPKMSTSLLMDLHLLCGDVLRGYYGVVKPVLLFCGLLQDEFIRKTFEFKDMRPIYEAAMETKAERMNMLEEIASARGEDFWEILRDPDCKVKKPTENGFVFRDLPWGHCVKWQLDKVVKSLRIKDGEIESDDKIIRQESLRYPTDRMRELYDLAADFCEAVNAMNLKRPNIIKWLFVYDKDGNIQPSEKGILFGLGVR